MSWRVGLRRSSTWVPADAGWASSILSGIGVAAVRFFFFQAEDGIRDLTVTGVQTCALPISLRPGRRPRRNGLHAGVAGRHAHRRAQPHEADRRRRHPLRRQLHPALPRAEVVALCAAVAVVAAGCGSDRARRAEPPEATGPANVVRVALTNFHWPLDPALAAGRDETTLARALYSTPLRTDPVTGAVVPGLCTAWRASPDFTRWTFKCHDAPSIAAALRRVVRLPQAPDRWLFAGVLRIAAPTSSSLVVRLDEPWRRFPYALTAISAAPRFVPGPFRLVSGSPRRVVVSRPGLTVVFRRLGAYAALDEFRRGRLDEAPVPVGDIVATQRDPTLGASLRATRLLAQDVVVFRGGPALSVIHAYGDTADRTDHAQLVPELAGSAAIDLVGRGDRLDPARFREALKRIPSLPGAQVRIGVPSDPALRFGAGVLSAQWRDIGLGPVLVADSAGNVATDF